MISKAAHIAARAGQGGYSFFENLLRHGIVENKQIENEIEVHKLGEEIVQLDTAHKNSCLT